MASESSIRNKFVSGLRQLHRYYWPPKKEAIAAARYRVDGDRKYYCDCVQCGKRLTLDEIEVDHIEDVGLQPDLVAGEIGPYCDRLFCGVDNYQILCHECHRLKSAESNKKNRQKRKELKFNFLNISEKERKCLILADSTARDGSRAKSKKRRSDGSKKTGTKRKSSG